MGASIGLAQGYVLRRREDARHRHHRRLHVLPCGHARAGQRRAAPGAADPDHHGQRLDEHDGHAGQPRHGRQLPAAGQPRLDIAKIVPALGVDQFWIVDPFDLQHGTRAIQNAFKLPGVKVVLARQECVMPAAARAGSRRREAIVEETATSASCASSIPAAWRSR